MAEEKKQKKRTKKEEVKEKVETKKETKTKSVKEVKTKTTKKTVKKSQVKESKEKKEKEVKTTKKATKSKKSKKKYVLVKAKRKTAIARAVVKAGHGRITINKIPYNLMSNNYLYDLFREPLLLAENYKKGITNEVDIAINVKGGGQVSQIVAARSCVAKGLLQYYDDPKLKDLFNKYDNNLLVDDTRRKEPKKQLGRGARAKWQHSKR